MASPEKKEYKTTPGVDHGYGPRIWVKRYEDVEVQDILKRMSRWGGSDKSDAEFISYEFSERRFKIACELLEELGYTNAGYW